MSKKAMWAMWLRPSLCYLRKISRSMEMLANFSTRDTEDMTWFDALLPVGFSSTTSPLVVDEVTEEVLREERTGDWPHFSAILDFGGRKNLYPDTEKMEEPSTSAHIYYYAEYNDAKGRYDDFGPTELAGRLAYINLVQSRPKSAAVEARKAALLATSKVRCTELFTSKGYYLDENEKCRLL
ncbi:hypothetical protein BJ508DRAFT_321342 [Ascobolus immersus RN42]|uniref:Uncharacterized protein n=1 Tax=Ascobolus immersus RN42 TaxID=1160509 RepID=A0A3N4IM38_ASCIM|nr:hypothetical protein BJ508DRAFT_321342 [Ascobolus immersus RN42]